MDLIIVDCQNDFVSGSLKAKNGEEAVEKISEFLRERDDISVYYTSDFHPQNHISFEEEGGPWPPHCVAGTNGAEIHDKLLESKYPPNVENTYFKGRNAKEEEYSAFNARNGYDELLKDVVGKKVYICGIASEYCVRETALQFKKSQRDVVVLKDLLGYIDEKTHEENLEDLKNKGIIIE